MAFELRAAFRVEDQFSKTFSKADKEIKSMVKSMEKLSLFAEKMRNSVVDSVSPIDKIEDKTRSASLRAERLARSFRNVEQNAIKAAAASRMIDNNVPSPVPTPTVMEAPTSLLKSPHGMAITVPLVITGAEVALSALAPVTAGIMGLTSSFSSAALGATAFGAVAVSSLTKVFDASEEVKKIQENIYDATTVKQRIKAEQQLANLYGDMSKQQLKAVKTLQKFENFWGDFTRQFDKPVFQSFTYSLEIAQKALTALKPTIDNVANSVVKMLSNLNQSFDNGSFKGVFDWLEHNAARSLENFATSAGNVFGGVAGVLNAFTEHGKGAENTLVSLTQKFEDWGQSLKNNTEFKKFIDYAQKNGPAAFKTFKESLILVGNVMKILGTQDQKGTTNLDKIADVLEKVNTAASKVSVAFGTFKTIMSDTTPFLNAVFPIAGVGKAIWDLVPSLDGVIGKVGELWSWINEKWQGIKVWTSETWDAVKNKISESMESARIAVSDFFSPLLGFIEKAKEAWQSFEDTFANFSMPKINWPSPPSWWNKIKSGSGSRGGKKKTRKKDADGSHATGLASVPFDGYMAQLHAEESVLTASQSNLLRSLGVLKSSGDRPVLDTSKFKQTKAHYTGRKQESGREINVTNHFTIHVNNGQDVNKDLVKKVTRVMVRELESVVSNGGV